MPSHKVHCYVDRVLFGKSYWRLHRQIDMPYLFLGRKHRVLFHDGFTSVAIARKVYPDDPIAQEAALVHVQLDALCSSNPLFAKQLEFFAEQQSRLRKRAGKKEAKPGRRPAFPGPFEDFNAFLEKLAELRRLSKIVFG